MDRQLAAYLLIFLMVAALGAIIAYARYNTHDRKVQRRRDREQAALDRRRSEQAEGKA